jgi:protease IV
MRKHFWLYWLFPYIPRNVPMRDFFKYVAATLVGMAIYGLFSILLFIGVGTAIGLATKSGDKAIKENTILRLDFSTPISEKSNDNPFAEFFGDKEVSSLEDVRKAIRSASTNKNVKGILLNPRSIAMGLSTSDEIRQELLSFKKKGKFIIAYLETATEGAYYMASVADKIYITPEGIVEFNGLASNQYFLKGMFEKLEVKPEVFRVGTYKSFVEPFILDKMSAANREQVTSYLNSLYGHMIQNVANSRKLTVVETRMISDSMKVRNAQDALRYHIVDQVAYYDIVEADLRKRLGTKEKVKLQFASLDRVASDGDDSDDDKEEKKADTNDDNIIQVITAEGGIASGGGDNDGDDGGITSDELCAQIRKARLNDKVKAVVLRINSPGGDAIASDIIWREVTLTNEKKPVIASMSDVAASGGYYIAMGARKIFAQPMTITGSIGVFGIFFNTGDFFRNKTGITFDGVKTGAYSDFPNATRKFTPAESAAMQQFVNQIYGTFTAKAAKGRKMPLDKLQEVASGRVWTGIEAKERGLIDDFGGLEEAIAEAAKEAKLKKGAYNLKESDDNKTFIDRILNKMTGNDDNEEEAAAQIVTRVLGAENARVLQLYVNMQKLQGIQARELRTYEWK